VVFAISEKAVNFYDFAMMFKQEFGCQNALYLDGVEFRECACRLWEETTRTAISAASLPRSGEP
jgi:uncharacterized protein YigE (DUF2233 family)